MKNYPSLFMRKRIRDDELKKIIEDAKKDNDDALARLSEYGYARIYTYIYYRVNHREDAEDLTSEVVLKVIKALKNQKGNFNAWIYKIASNAVIDFYRRRGVRSEVSISEMPGEIPDKSVSFSKQILTQEKLRHGLDRLTEEQSRVIILKFIEGYSNSEIAKIMGKSVGAVKVLQFRALRALRKHFRNKGYEIKN